MRFLGERDCRTLAILSAPMLKKSLTD